jgi:hypothetical protein
MELLEVLEKPSAFHRPVKLERSRCLLFIWKGIRMTFTQILLQSPDPAFHVDIFI